MYIYMCVFERPGKTHQNGKRRGGQLTRDEQMTVDLILLSFMFSKHSTGNIHYFWTEKRVSK